MEVLRRLGHELIWRPYRVRHDSDYLRNRIARLSFDLKTGGARIEE